MFHFNGNILQSSFSFFFFALCAKNKRTLRGSYAVCLSALSFHLCSYKFYCAVIYCLRIRLEGCHLAYYSLQGKKRCISPFILQPHLHFFCRFQPVQKCLFASSSLSFRPSVYNNSAPTGQIFFKIYIRVFLLKKFVDKIQILLKLEKNTGQSM